MGSFFTFPFYIPTCKFKVGLFIHYFNQPYLYRSLNILRKGVNSLFKVDDINLIMNHTSVSNLINVNIKNI